MTVENATYIGGLIRATPSPQDFKKEGDDQIRLLKAVLLNSILGFSGAAFVQGMDSGTANVYRLVPPTQLQSYTVGTMVLMTPANMNGGASTLNISGLGARPIQRIDGTALVNGDLVPGQPALMAYDGTAFRLLAVTKAYIDQLVLSGVLPGQSGNAGKPLITNGATATFSSAFGIAMDEAKGADIAATPTLNLTSVAGTGNWTHITGTGVTINAITLPAGAERDLVIDSAGNILAHSATLDLPGAANITTQASDRMTVRGDGAKAIVTNYARASGRAVVEQMPPGWVLLTPTPVVPAAGVSAIDFLNIFSSTYDDYAIVCQGLTLGTAGEVEIRLARGGVVDSAANYGQAIVNGANGSTESSIGSEIATTDPIALEIKVLGANVSAIGSYQHVFLQAASGAVGGIFKATAVNGLHRNAATAGPLTGFRLYVTGTTFNAAGSIKIYGIRKA